MIRASSHPADLKMTGVVNVTAAADKGRPTFKIDAYNGGPIRVGGFYRPVVIDLAGLRAGQTVPILLDHDPTQIVGQGKPTITKTNVTIDGVVTGDFASAGEPAGKVVSHAKAGFAWAASVGVGIDATENLGENQTANVNGRQVTGPALIVRKGRLAETSFVAVGADESASAKVAARAAKGKVMDFEAFVLDAGFDPATLTEKQRSALMAAFQGQGGGTVTATAQDVEVERGLRAAEDRQRWRDVLAAKARGSATNNNRQAIEDAIIEANMRDVDRMGMELAMMRASHMSMRDIMPRSHNGGVGTDGLAAGNGTAIQTAILIHCGYKSLAEKAFSPELVAAGERMKDQIGPMIRLAGKGGDALVRATGISTGDFSTALSGITGKTLQQSFSDVPQTYSGWVGVKSVPDFKDGTAIRAYFTDGAYEEVGAGGEIKHGAYGEETYTHKAKTFGKMLTATRQALVNDDLGAFIELVTELGRQGARKLADEIYKKLLSATTSNFLSATGNISYIAGAGTVLSATSLETAIGKFRNRTDGSGKPIDVAPAVLVVPPALEFSARALLNSTMMNRTGDNSPMGNPYASIATLAVEPRLSNSTISSAASEKAWYLFSAPNICPALVVSFLNGAQSPTVEQVALQAEVLGMGWRAYFDFGVDFADARGLVKNKGEA